MTTTTKAIAGIGGLLATATVPSTYLVISSSSGSGEEAAKVDNRPTGGQWLLSSGYTFNKPTFKSQDNLNHGCSDNLFSNAKDKFNPQEDSKIYGCAVMKMELGKTGILFQSTLTSGRTNIDPKYIKFNSEIAIRKGGEGWVINSRVDNWSNDGQTYFEYLLTAYKYDGTKWNKDGNSKLWEDPSLSDGAIDILNHNYGDNTINSHNKLLVIKVPTETWFDSSDWVSSSTVSNINAKTPEETKNWSGVWINDSDAETSSWIFEGIELYMIDKKYSQIFCKGETDACFQKNAAGGNTKTQKPKDENAWSTARTGPQNDSEKVTEVIPTISQKIIDKLKDSRGTWMKLENICDSEVDGTPDKERQQQLRMYCSNGRQIN